MNHFVLLGKTNMNLKLSRLSQCCTNNKIDLLKLLLLYLIRFWIPRTSGTSHEKFESIMSSKQLINLSALYDRSWNIETWPLDPQVGSLILLKTHISISHCCERSERPLWALRSTLENLSIFHRPEKEQKNPWTKTEMSKRERSTLKSNK